MKVLMTSERLPPNRGGLSTVAQILISGLVKNGHTLHLATTEIDGPEKIDGVGVLRLQGPIAWISYFRTLRTVDVVLQNNISLKTIWLPFLLRKKIVVSLHIWVESHSGRITWREKVKIAVLRRITSVVSPNREMFTRSGIKGEFLANGYDDEIFLETASIENRIDGFICVARLVEDKGVSQLIHAFSNIAELIPSYTLTIIGEGPERNSLEESVQSNNLQNRIFFKGAMNPLEVSRELNQNRFMVVPSLCDEIFGLVTLEGLACGLPTIVTNHKGLLEAQSGFGKVVELGEQFVNQLESQMLEFAKNPSQTQNLMLESASYLETRNKAAMIAGYEKVLENAIHA